jgi:hypothetical protein
LPYSLEARSLGTRLSESKMNKSHVHLDNSKAFSIGIAHMP